MQLQNEQSIDRSALKLKNTSTNFPKDEFIFDKFMALFSFKFMHFIFLPTSATEPSVQLDLKSGTVRRRTSDLSYSSR